MESGVVTGSDSGDQDSSVAGNFQCLALNISLLIERPYGAWPMCLNVWHVCGCVPCTSRLTECKRPWWSNRIVYKQVWESNQTVWQTIKTVWFDWSYWLTQIQSHRLAHMCYKQSELIYVQINIFNSWIYGIPLSKYTLVITAKITILLIFNCFPAQSSLHLTASLILESRPWNLFHFHLHMKFM